MRKHFSLLLSAAVALSLSVFAVPADAARTKPAKTAASLKGKVVKKNGKYVLIMPKTTRLSAKYAKGSKLPSRLAAVRHNKVRQLALRANGARATRVAAVSSSLDDLSLYSSAALVVNAVSGERIYEKNSSTVTPIASITKLMTAMVVLDAHLPMDELLTVSEEDTDQLKNTGSRLSVGTTLTRGEMMHIALMSSENRAASTLGRNYPGGLAAFVARMNRKAAQLGMKDSRFFDPTGLNSGNVSSANDLQLMVQAAARYPEIHEYSTSTEYRFESNVTGRTLTYRNTNPLVKNPGWEIDVSKTGYINESGKCLVMHAHINGTPVVMVLLDSAGKYTRIGDATRIRKWLETNPEAKLRAG